MAATRAAGAMLLPTASSNAALFVAAALVHAATSLFWAVVLARFLPPRRETLWSTLAALVIGVLDLGVIAPAFFPQVAALEFWPQMADHLMWGVCFGATLQSRRKA